MDSGTGRTGRGRALRRGASLVSLLVLVFALTVPPAAAAQMEADDPPKVSGELEQVARKCGQTVEKHAETDQTLGIARSCLFFFEFDPANETDAAQDYGVVWLQTSFNGMNGWCAVKVNSDVHFPKDPERPLGLYAHSPVKELTTSARKEVTVKLATTAQDNSPQSGQVAQTFNLYPQSTTPSVKELETSTRFRLAWEGETGRKVAFASGMEISWRVVDGRPEGFDFGVRYALAKTGNC